jgi:hypothetical protein
MSHKTLQNPIRIKGIRTGEGPHTCYPTTLRDLQKLFQIPLRPVNATAATGLSKSRRFMQDLHKGLDVFCVTRRVLNPPSALRRYQVPGSGSRLLGLITSVHCRLLDLFLPVMQWVPRNHPHPPFPSPAPYPCLETLPPSRQCPSRPLRVVVEVVVLDVFD